MPTKNSYLLPRDVEPRHYRIRLIPDFETFTFQGGERIAVTVKNPTSKITLHSLDLEIVDAYVSWEDPGRCLVRPSKMRFNQQKQTVTLYFDKEIEAGNAELALYFKGQLNDEMHGFYRTSYDVNGEKHWDAVTQFEATDARRAFPCWDEPDIKAEFSLTLVVPKSLVALSNMPIIQCLFAGDAKTVIFKKTPKMSTYLLAVVVADLECLEAVDKNGVVVRVWTTPGKEELGRFALEKGLHTLPYFAEWFGIPYALPKLDMVAIPDFAAGAMENWGLVTFRETALLVDPENSSTAARQRVSHVVDHELAHQWFGNLVTMQWWTHLWLNEGFASYMGPKATDHQFPEWRQWEQYVAEDYLGALHEDGLLNTHPVEVDVKNPYEIRSIFDGISYGKGSVLNRMLEHYLGEDDFRKGLNLYLTRHAYGNASTNDLWQALEEVSGKPVKKIMAGYTRRGGYPIISVEARKENNGQCVLEMAQERFTSDGGVSFCVRSWQIPVGFIVPGKQEPQFYYMAGKKANYAIPAWKNSWVKLNPDQSGFYRVAYTEEMYKELAEAVKWGQLSVIDRIGLLDDVFALARAGHIRTSQALEFLKSYKWELDLSVWSVIAARLAVLHNLLSAETCRNDFEMFAREFFRPIAELYKWDKVPADRDRDVLLRSLALRNFGGYGDYPTLLEAKRRFTKFIYKKELDPNLRQVVFSLVAENGGMVELENLLSVYRSTDLHEEKLRAVGGASCCQIESVLKRLLDFSVSEDMRAQDAPLVIMNIGSHSMGRNVAWEFLKEHWDLFMERYHKSGFGFMPRIIGITSGFTTQEQYKDVSDFLKSHPIFGAERPVHQALEIIRSNIDWLRRDRADIEAFLSVNRQK